MGKNFRPWGGKGGISRHQERTKWGLTANFNQPPVGKIIRILNSFMERSSKFLIVSQPKSKILRRRVYLLIRSDEKVYKLKRYTNNRSNEGLTLQTSAFLPFTVANLRFQLSLPFTVANLRFQFSC